MVTQTSQLWSRLTVVTILAVCAILCGSCSKEADETSHIDKAHVAGSPAAMGEFEAQETELASVIFTPLGRRVLHGRARRFSENGMLLVEGSYRHGLRHGEWRYYSSSGDVLATEYWLANSVVGWSGEDQLEYGEFGHTSQVRSFLVHLDDSAARVNIQLIFAPVRAESFAYRTKSVDSITQMVEWHVRGTCRVLSSTGFRDVESRRRVERVLSFIVGQLLVSPRVARVIVTQP